MDQELCRTRGQRRKPKRVHILFYRHTYEEEKLRRVLTALVAIKMYGQFTKFSLAPSWKRWLTEHRPRTLPEYLNGIADRRAKAPTPAR
jgi:hypothetical protein